MKLETKGELEAVLVNRKGSPEVNALIQLLEWHLERVKNNLTSAIPDHVLRLQGEATGYKTLLKMFDRTELPFQRQGV